MVSEPDFNFDQDLAQATVTLGGLRQMVVQLARLCEISITLISTLNVEELLQHIIETAVEVLDCEAASIMLYDEQQGQLMFAAATGSDTKKLIQIPVPLEGSIAGTIFRENKPLLIKDVQQDPRHFSSVSQEVKFQPRSLVGVPMTIHEKVIGVLEALNKRGRYFTQKDEHLLAIIASQAAVAIHNARLHEALQSAYDDLSRVDKLKSDFMAIASHELRTPLGVILGYATFLKEEARGELSEHANMVLNSAMRLRSIVEDMTNMNLLQFGSLDMTANPIVLQKVLQAAYEEIAATAQAKGQTFNIRVRREPVLVRADADKLELVFVNILNNAIRFTPGGGNILIEMLDKNHEVWVKISDNGIGIPPGELHNVFKQFYQVEDHMTRRHGGLGLGLAIAKGIVETHKGRIWAESEGTKGASIIVVLPRVERT